jgi:hypothetical protein
VIQDRTPLACRKASIATAASSAEATLVSILDSGFSSKRSGREVLIVDASARLEMSEAGGC